MDGGVCKKRLSAVHLDLGNLFGGTQQQQQQGGLNFGEILGQLGKAVEQSGVQVGFNNGAVQISQKQPGGGQQPQPQQGGGGGGAPPFQGGKPLIGMDLLHSQLAVASLVDYLVLVISI